MKSSQSVSGCYIKDDFIAFLEQLCSAVTEMMEHEMCLLTSGFNHIVNNNNNNNRTKRLTAGADQSRTS